MVSPFAAVEGPTSESVIDVGNLIESFGVGNAQTLHAVRMPVFLEMTFVGASAPVRVVPADFALELYSQAM